jgi:hypothetical protein
MDVLLQLEKYEVRIEDTELKTWSNRIFLNVNYNIPLWNAMVAIQRVQDIQLLVNYLVHAEVALEDIRFSDVIQDL